MIWQCFREYYVLTIKSKCYIRLFEKRWIIIFCYNHNTIIHIRNNKNYILLMLTCVHLQIIIRDNWQIVVSFGLYFYFTICAMSQSSRLEAIFISLVHTCEPASGASSFKGFDLHNMTSGDHWVCPHFKVLANISSNFVFPLFSPLVCGENSVLGVIFYPHYRGQRSTAGISIYV